MISAGRLLTPASAGTPPVQYTIYTTQTPTHSVGGSYELGTLFQTTQAGNVVALRRYHKANADASMTGTLWRVSDQANLGSVAIVTATPAVDGWVQASLASPVAILANTSYMVSYGYTSSSAYYIRPALLYTNGPLTTTTSDHGYYSTTPGSYPGTNANPDSSYAADIVLEV